MSDRSLQRVIRSVPVSDGAGVRLRRSLGLTPDRRLDPFLLLDEISSENPGDYIAGFPEHPHRGFETVTYMLEGRLLHEDHLGHRGELRSGGAQWMTAGRGIIHSEMPQQESGRLRGFQLWINLPARLKMKPASYRDIQPADIPRAALPGGGTAKVIAGTLDAGGITVDGPVAGLATAPLFLDVRLPAGGRISQAIAPGHNAFVYVYEGTLAVGGGEATRSLRSHEAGLLSEGAA
ncbi:MAG TPA: pirin family protein, partial [Burkholderiales bacterium]